MSGPRLENQLQPGRCVFPNCSRYSRLALIARVGATLAVTLGMTIAALGGEGRAAAVDVWKLPN